LFALQRGAAPVPFEGTPDHTNTHWFLWGDRDGRSRRVTHISCTRVCMHNFLSVTLAESQRCRACKVHASSPHAHA
jgi:hypothetical protein